jgi:hypothetical protein
MTLEATLRAIVRDELRVHAEALRGELRGEFVQLREAMTPKLLDRAGLAKLLGMTPVALRQHLYPRKGKLSDRGAILISLAVVGPDGEQRWRTADIAAHCRPWLRGGDGGDDNGGGQ